MFNEKTRRRRFQEKEKERKLEFLDVLDVDISQIEVINSPQSNPKYAPRQIHQTSILTGLKVYEKHLPVEENPDQLDELDLLGILDDLERLK